MKLKDLFEKNTQRRYYPITNVKKENIVLEMKPLKKIGKSIFGLLIALMIILGLLLINFNVKYFTVSIALILLFVLLFIFGNRCIIQCDKETLNIKQGFQRLNIPYKNLKNVYIGQVSGLLFFLPAFNYNIVVRYEDNFSFLRELEFSLLCADEKDVEAFLNNFEIEQEVQERYVQYERRKFGKKALSFIFTLILVIIVAIFLYPIFFPNM